MKSVAEPDKKGPRRRVNLLRELKNISSILLINDNANEFVRPAGELPKSIPDEISSAVFGTSRDTAARLLRRQKPGPLQLSAMIQRQPCVRINLAPDNSDKANETSKG